MKKRISIVSGCFGSVGGSAKKSGAHCLCGSNSIILVFGVLLWLITTLLFLIGGMSDKLVCQTLKDPSSSEIYEAASDAFNTFLHDTLSIEEIENATFEFDKIIDSCAEDGSIYSVFNLSLVYNISELLDWQETYNISVIIDQATTSIDDGIDELVDGLVIDDDTRKGIEEIAEEFSVLTGNTFDNINSINISELVPDEILEKVNKTLIAIEDGLPGIDIDNIKQVTNDVANVKTILTDDVSMHLNEVFDFVVELNKTLIYNNSCDINCTVNTVLDLADSATEYINATARADIIRTTDETIESVLDLGNVTK